jgi:hypothetical protein
MTIAVLSEIDIEGNVRTSPRLAGCQPASLLASSST